MTNRTSMGASYGAPDMPVKMVGHVSETLTIDELPTLVADRMHTSGDSRALVAFAALEPQRAAQWLLEAHGENAASRSRSRTKQAVALIADAFVEDPQRLAPALALAFFARFGHLLPADGVVEFASQLGARASQRELATVVRAARQLAPEAPGLLRVAVDLALAEQDAAEAHALLTQLGRCDSTMATMRFIHGARRRLPQTGDPALRIALLSSFTIDPLVPFLDLECRALRLEPSIYVAPFNTWDREMLGEGSGLARHDPQIVFLSVALDDLVPELAGAISASDLASAGHAAVDRILAAATQFVSWSPATLVVHALYSTHRDPLGTAAARYGPARSEVVAELNARLAAGLRGIPRAYLIDIADVLVRRRQGTVDNPKMRHLASMRLGEQVLEDVARACARFVAPVAGRTRKCIVLDLDNTLWGGIVGEDGPHGIRLGDTSPGSEFREFQRYLQSLATRGMLLAVNSKNNEGDALEVIRSHEAMVLREDAFSAMRINWESKTRNLLGIAEELNLGLDAFVFVDDNEKERALMRQTFPQVLTPDMPRDPALYRETLENLPELQTLTITEEDQSRTRLYVERRQRETLRVASQTLEEYLRSLEMVVETERASERTLSRIHQLFQRTNQFNLTTRRYDPGVLAARAAAPTWRVYTTRVSDRFGDHGLVAAAVVQCTEHAWNVENFVMSCRVIGYGVETALLARIAAEARECGARHLVGEFIPSTKNAPARDFYARNGFRPDSDEKGIERWRRDLADGGPATPEWIATARQPHGA